MKLFKTFIFVLFTISLYSQGIEPFQFQGTEYKRGFIRGGTVKYWDEAMQDSLYIYEHVDSTLSVSGGSGTVKGLGQTNKVAYWASSDSLTYDTSFHWIAASKSLGIGTNSPNTNLHLHGSTFPGLRISNTTTGLSGGGRMYQGSDTLYIVNAEPGSIEMGTNSVSRLKIDYNGEVTIPNLASGNTAPTTSGTTKKVINDANGKLSFKTDTNGTVTSVAAATGTSGTDFNISGSPVTSSGTITFNIPTASGSNRGALSSTDWTTFNGKFNLPSLTSGSVLFSNGSTITQDNTNIFYNSTYKMLGIGTNSPTTYSPILNAGLVVYHSSTPIISMANSGRKWLWYGTGNQLRLWNDANNELFYLEGDKVGIKRASPVRTLDIDGTFRFSGSVGTADRILGRQNSTGDVTDILTGNGLTISSNILSVTSPTTGTEGEVTWWSPTLGITSDADLYWLNANNILSIGTKTPTSYTPLLDRGLVIYGASQAQFAMANSTRKWLWYNTGNELRLWNDANNELMWWSGDKVGVRIAPTRTLDIGGEVRIRDLTTDTPTGIVGHDSDGDLGTVSIGTGLSLSSGTLTNTVVLPNTWANISNHIISWASTGTFGSGYPVGIGTATASRLLDVNGDARLRGAIYDASNSAGTSGNVLTSNGTSAVSWNIPAASQYAYLFYNGSTTITANSATLLSAANYTTLGYASNGAFTNSATNRIRCDFTGTVEINIDATWEGGDGASTTHSLNVYKNGSSGFFPSIDANSVALSGSQREQHSYRNGIIVDVTTNDYFEFYYTCPSSTSLVLPLMTIKRIK